MVNTVIHSAPSAVPTQRNGQHEPTAAIAEQPNEPEMLRPEQQSGSSTVVRHPEPDDEAMALRWEEDEATALSRL